MKRAGTVVPLCGALTSVFRIICALINLILQRFFCVLCLDLSYTHIYSVKEYILELDEGRNLFTRGSMPLQN